MLCQNKDRALAIVCLSVHPGIIVLRLFLQRGLDRDIALTISERHITMDSPNPGRSNGPTLM